MEKHLPITAVIIENVAISIATLVLVSKSLGAGVILAPLAIIIMVSLFLKKDWRVLGLAFLASVAFTLYTNNPSPSSNIFLYVLIGICALEIIIFISSLTVTEAQKIASPLVINGGFAFLGVIIGITYRVFTCHPVKSDYITSYLISLITPVCSMATGEKYGNKGIPLDLIFYLPILVPVFASFAETARFQSGFVGSFISWIVTSAKAFLIGGIINIGLLYLVNSAIPQEWVDKPFIEYDPVFFWLIYLIATLISCYVYGWSATFGNSK